MPKVFKFNADKINVLQDRPHPPKASGQIFLLTAIKRHVWKCSRIVLFCFSRHVKQYREMWVRQKVLISSHESSSCYIGFALLMEMKIITLFSSLCLCSHFGQLCSYHTSGGWWIAIGWHIGLFRSLHLPLCHNIHFGSFLTFLHILSCYSSPQWLPPSFKKVDMLTVSL